MPRLILPPNRRIKKRLDFAAAKKEGKKFFTEHLIVYSRQSNLDYPRLGVVVSKKVSKRAVDRNLIKRRIREVFRLNQYDFINTDLVFIAKRSVLLVSYQDLSNEIMKALNKAKVLKIQNK